MTNEAFIGLKEDEIIVVFLLFFIPLFVLWPFLNYTGLRNSESPIRPNKNPINNALTNVINN